MFWFTSEFITTSLKLVFISFPFTSIIDSVFISMLFVSIVIFLPIASTKLFPEVITELLLDVICIPTDSTIDVAFWVVEPKLVVINKPDSWIFAIADNKELFEFDWIFVPVVSIKEFPDSVALFDKYDIKTPCIEINAIPDDVSFPKEVDIRLPIAFVFILDDVSTVVFPPFKVCVLPITLIFPFAEVDSFPCELAIASPDAAKFVFDIKDTFPDDVANNIPFVDIFAVDEAISFPLELIIASPVVFIFASIIDCVCSKKALFAIVDALFNLLK